MKFTKMQGCGNDYVYIDCTNKDTFLDETTLIDGRKFDASELSVKISDRHYGVGSDGLILIMKSESADFCMSMYNADGTRAEMCGNGIRCFGKFVYEHGLTNKTELIIETLGGQKELKLIVKDGIVCEVSVDMGEPITKPSEIPVIFDGPMMQDIPIVVGETNYRMTCVSVGNPHAIVYVEESAVVPLDEIGPLFENNSIFPKRVNTEFVQIVDRKHLVMRVWERGSGETWACGTGATACAYASMINGLVEDEVAVEMLGGTLMIRYDRKTNHLFMTGPAVTVFEGEWIY